MMRKIIAALCFCCASPAVAQDGAYLPFALQAKQLAGKAREQAEAAETKASAATTIANTTAQNVTSSVATLSAKIPVPASTVPPTERVGGATGTAGTYRPADAVQPRITRAGVVATDNAGAWSITWSTALPTPPVTLPIPINTGTQPVVCNVATSTATSASGRCWLARTLPATLVSVVALVSYDVMGAPATGISVQVLAIPMTQ